MLRHAPRTFCSFLRREVPRSARARRPASTGAVIAPYRVGPRFPGSKRGLVDECSRPVSRETSFPPSNHDDGGRRREQVNAAQYDMLVNTSEPADGVAMLVEFLRSTATFSANRCPPGFRSGKHHAASDPAGNGSRRHPGHRRYPTDDGALFGATAHHADPRASANAATASSRNVTRRAWARRGRCADQAVRRRGRCQVAQLPTRCPPLARHAVATRRPPRSSAGAVPKSVTPRADPAIRAPRRTT